MPLLNNNRSHILALLTAWFAAAAHLVAVTLAMPTGALAADSGCPLIIPPPPPWPDSPTQTTLHTPAVASAVSIRADQMRIENNGEALFTGHVTLKRDRTSLYADQITYKRQTDEASVTGPVLIQEMQGTSFNTSGLTLQLGSRQGRAGPVEFLLGGNNARGDAKRIDFQGPDVTRLSSVRYTTCAPGQDSWFLRISKLKLDIAKDIGSATHASVNFMHVPIFYFPYMTFPLADQRKSGFLAPQFGSSEKLGAFLATPYYLNLAPNYDATLTPRYLSKRGMQLQSQFRYLGQTAEGLLEAEYLSDDDEFNGENRGAGSFQHRQTFNPLWSTTVDLRGVSDKNYLDDFGQTLGITSQTHLPQKAELAYRGPAWSFSARATDYQTVDATIAKDDQPYARLPQLRLATNTLGQANRPVYHFDSELTSFEHESLPTGKRLTLNPAISYPWKRSYGFITPKLGAKTIGYDLDETVDDTPTLARGFFSLDSGLFFDRPSRWRGRSYTQTLEPRLYYFYLPDKNQDALPNFDTTVPDLSFTNLFRENRFVGGDRIGDANQATLALTSRLIDEDSGVERIRISAGQIFYFDDRKVSLPAGTRTANSSDVVAEAAAKLMGNWYLRGNIQHNRDSGDTQKSSLYLQYHPIKKGILNLGRRTIRDVIEQTDVSLEWPLHRRWTVRLRSLYSQRDDKNLESYAGLQYNACCWAMRLFANRRLSGDNEQVDYIMFEFELTGLAKLGSVPVSPLQQSVFSFND